MKAIFPNLGAIEAALKGQEAVTRFAPSPTGYLHLGHVVNALYVWGIAGALGGKVILRLEDHDQQRCRPEYEAALLEDLEWLGLVPDIGEIAEFRAGSSPFRQSDCGAVYTAFLARLRDQPGIYACDCSRKAILERALQAGNGELRYDGHCRSRGLKEMPGLGIRLQTPRGEVHFVDILVGSQHQLPTAQVGDVLLQDRNGQWTYQFAVVSDDIYQGVNLIIRGMDILSSSGRQIQIARMLGRKNTPVLLHHKLLVDAKGRKLSKRDFAQDIHMQKIAGTDPQDILGAAAFQAGLIPNFQKIAVRDLPGLFLANSQSEEPA